VEFSTAAKKGKAVPLASADAIAYHTLPFSYRRHEQTN
jgi:hypothetical protein